MAELSKESVGCWIKNPEVFELLSEATKRSSLAAGLKKEVFIQIPSEASRESVGCWIMKTRRRFSLRGKSAIVKVIKSKKIKC